MSISDIAEVHGVSRATVHTYRRGGTFPSPVQEAGTTRLRYRADEVAAWFQANPKQQGKRTDLTEKPQGDPVTTTVDPRIAILSGLNAPPYNTTAEKHCIPWDDAVKLLDAYRKKMLRLAAEAVEQELLSGPDTSEDGGGPGWSDAVRAAGAVLRQMAEAPDEESSDG